MNIQLFPPVSKQPSKDPDENFEVTLAGPILEQVLCDLIKKRDAVIVKLFRMAIVDDYKFFEHIRNLKDLLLMDWSGFCNRLPIRVSYAHGLCFLVWVTFMNDD